MLVTVLAAIPLLTCAVAAPVEVPFRTTDEAIIVDATVNGRKVSLLFDSGFSGSVKLDSTINVGKPTGVMNLVDFVGTFEAGTVKMKSLKVGEETIDPTGMEIVQVPDEHMSAMYNTHVDGILGMQALNKGVVEINFEKQKFIFYPASEDITKRKPDNKRTFLVKMLPRGVNAIELPVLTKDGELMPMTLDTGNAGYAATHRDSLERVGIWKEGAKPTFVGSALIASGAVDEFDTMMSDMTIFGVPVPQSVWGVMDLPSSSADSDGTIGFEFLKHFNIVIDATRRRVWLDNFTGKTSEPPKADVGLAAYFSERTKRFRIVHVMPGSPADKAGIKKGDDLLGIDGKELLNMGARKVRALLEGELGSTVKVGVSRDGLYQSYDLKREYLINGMPPKSPQ